MSKPIKTAIAGMGRAGSGMHLKELKNRQDKFQVVAFCDIEQERCDRLLKDYPDCKTYTSVEELVLDPDIELVSVATRSTEHVKHAVICLEAGKDVFLEKPIAMNREEAEELRIAAEKSDAKLCFRHNRHFEPAFQHIREIIAEGILGDVYEIKLRRNGYQRRNDWQTIIGCGGGQLNNWGPHIIDHALKFLESPVKEMWSDLKKIAAVGDAEDHIKIILKGENDRIIDLEISGGAALPEPNYIIFGSKGALTCTDNEIKLRYIDPEQKLADIQADPNSPPVDGAFGNAEQLQWIEKTIQASPKSQCNTDHIWDSLYSAIRENVPFPIKFEEAYAVLDIVFKVKENSRFK